MARLGRRSRFYISVFPQMVFPQMVFSDVSHFRYAEFFRLHRFLACTVRIPVDCIYYVAAMGRQQIEIDRAGLACMLHM